MARRSLTVLAAGALIGGVALVPLAQPAQASVAAKSFTKAQVKRHNTPGNCWAIVNGSVYNFTAWISRHPGGGSAITAICGKDGSAAFNAQHGSAAAANAALKPYRIGSLK
mgnify:CR=1 FL=1